MDDPSEEIRRTARNELLGAGSENLSFICELLRLQKSGSISEKVDRIIVQSMSDILRALIVRRELFFSDLVQSDIRRDVLAEILDRYELPTNGNRYDMLLVLVANRKFDPEEILTHLNVQSVKRIYESIFAGHSLLEEDVLRSKIVAWVRGDPIASQWKRWESQPVPLTWHVPVAPATADVSETPRPPPVDHNWYPTTPPPEAVSSDPTKESLWGPLHTIPWRQKRIRLETSQAIGLWALFGTLVGIGLTIVIGSQSLGNAYGIDSGFFVGLGTTIMILGTVATLYLYRRAGHA